MAKKKGYKKDVKNTPITENALPQNILLIGERVEENKNIYISQSVYKEIHKFTENKTTNESGGVLVGNVVEEFGKTNIIINGFVEAKHCESTPTTLKFTHETWEYVHKEIDKKFPKQKIVGWIHTHPDFGIFLSEYDKFIHENFFKEEYQIAYVVDPIQNMEGFYFWINGKIERCKGFYKFDKMGVKIDSDVETRDDTAYANSWLSIKNIIIAVLAVCIVFLAFSNISQNREISGLEKQQKNLAASANQAISSMYQQIIDMQFQISILEEKVEELSGADKKDVFVTDATVDTDDDPSGTANPDDDLFDVNETKDPISSNDEESPSSTDDKNGGNQNE